MTDNKKINLKAEVRKIHGRKVKQLRRQGIIPANLYGKKIKSKSIQINEKEFAKVFDQAGETSIIYLHMGSSKTPHAVLINNIHLHPVSDKYLHIDFRQVDLTQKVKVSVPVEFKGESPAVAEGAVLVQQFNELEVEALPANLPEAIIFDLSQLKAIGDSLKLSDAQGAKDIDFELEDDTVIALVQEAKEEEPLPTPEEEETVEGEETTEGEQAPSEESDQAKSEEKPASSDSDKTSPKEEK